MSGLRLICCSLAIMLFVSCGESPTATDTTPPWSVSDLTVRGAPDGYHLRWTARGDDGNTGRASRYDVRYFAGDLIANWSVAQSAPSPPHPSSPGHPDSMTVQGIGEGPFQLGIKTADELGNWSAISNVVTASVDVTPPAAISDLSVRSTFQGFYLRWSAPGDNGMEHKAARYEIRYAESNLAGTWESSPIAPNVLVPAASGQADSTVVAGIGMGPWEIAVKSADASGNWSALSNVVATTIPDDATPPAPATDLLADMVTEGSVVLRWTATGDDGSSGQAWAYDIRYAPDPITSETWAGASRVTGPNPRPNGEGELFAVPGLVSGSHYYFAIKVLDETENASDLSNSVGATISTATQLTFDDNYGAHDPDWSPDGEHIAYGGTWYTQPYPIPALHVIPASGGTGVRYTSFYSADPSWSPDGAKFAFSLYVDEQTRTVLALMDATPEAPSEILIDPNVKSTGGATWSPDGTHIAYVASSHFIGEPPTSDLYSIPASGGTPQHLTGGGWGIGGVDWSPDGTQIVYSSNVSGNSDLWIMPSNGGEPIQLTTGAEKETYPAWSPDGRRIAFGRDDQVWILYLAESYSTQVTFDAEKKVFRGMTWSPNGTKIAFGAQMEGPEHPVTNLWVLSIH